jgi:SAM-dependent methyltransferase
MMMNQKNTSMIEYYAKRAYEYEKIYEKPERQDDLAMLKELLSDSFGGKKVLEVACGTGYWTQFVAKSAKSIFASDANREVLEIARTKSFGICKVEFAEDDAYCLKKAICHYDAGFHAFWWSHIPVQRIAEFLKTFHSKLISGAKVIMIDNKFIEGNSTPISRHDEDGNTYQIRSLKDGSRHEVLKNFPSSGDIQNQLKNFATDIKIQLMDYYWVAEYRVK